VILTDTPAGPSQGHSGFFPGYLTEMAYFPNLNVAAALQVNTSFGRALGRSPVSVLADLALAAGEGSPERVGWGHREEEGRKESGK